MADKILILEDEESVAITLAAILEAEGYDTVIMGDVTSALRRVEGEHFDGALLDLHVGAGDGFSVLRRIKEVHPEVVAIILTGYGTSESVLQAMRFGADDLLLKPSDIDELKLSIRRGLRRRDRVLERERRATERLASVLHVLDRVAGRDDLPPEVAAELRRVIAQSEPVHDRA